MRQAARSPEQIDTIKRKSEERKREHRLIKVGAENIVKVAKNYGEVDYSKLVGYIDSNNLVKMQSEAKALGQQILDMKKKEQALSDIIPDVHTWHKKFSMSELEGVYKSVESKLAQWSSLSLEQQVKKLQFEAVDYLGGNMYGVQSKYKTWEVSQKAYIKQLDIINNKIAVKKIGDGLGDVETWVKAHPKAAKMADLLKDVQDAIANGESLAEVKKKEGALRFDYNKRLAAERHLAKAAGMSKLDLLYKGNCPYTADEISKLMDYEGRIMNDIFKNGRVSSVLNDEYYDYALQLSKKYYSSQASIYTTKENAEMKNMLDRYVKRKKVNPNYIWGTNIGGVYDGGYHYKINAYMPQLSGLTDIDLTIPQRFTNGSTFSNCYNLRKSSPYWRQKFIDKWKSCGLTLSEMKEQFTLIEEWSQSAIYVLDKMERYNGITFRGLSKAGGPELRTDLLNAYNRGKLWVNEASCSTSTKISVSESFDGDTILIIHNKTGAYIHPISEYSSEYEVMTLRGAKYKILSPPKKISGTYFVELEEVL